MPNQKFIVWGLDVWGHVESDPKECDCTSECPGYTVNDCFRIGTVEIFVPSPGCEDRSGDVVLALVDGGFLTSDCTSDTIEVDGDPDFMIEIDDKSDGRYLLQLTPADAE